MLACLRVYLVGVLLRLIIISGEIVACSTIVFMYLILAFYI